MESITSLKELIEQFESADPGEHSKIIKKIDVPLTNFQQYASWKDGCYTRNCLAKTDLFEFILLCWDGNCETAIHDHADQNCWVYQADGIVKETRYSGTAENLIIESVGDLKPGQVSFMNDQLGYHKIENESGTKAMTLHIYVKPIDECLVLNEESEAFEMKQMIYDSKHVIAS